MKFVLSRVVRFSPYKAWEDRLHTARADLCPSLQSQISLLTLTLLTESLTSLSDKGLILFVQNHEASPVQLGGGGERGLAERGQWNTICS